VDATWVRLCSRPRNATGGADDAGTAPGPAELAELEVDAAEQAVAARPKPIMAVRISRSD
jgi:hypothetical protein